MCVIGLDADSQTAESPCSRSVRRVHRSCRQRSFSAVWLHTCLVNIKVEMRALSEGHQHYLSLLILSSVTCNFSQVVPFGISRWGPSRDRGAFQGP
jgi:hypothetical protein